MRLNRKSGDAPGPHDNIHLAQHNRRVPSFSLPLALTLALLSTTLHAADLKPQKYLAHIKYLSSPELKGRLTGSPELEKAATYIARQFHSAGLKRIAGSYLQEFDITAHTALGTGNKLTLVVAQRIKELLEGRDFAPLNLSTNGETMGAIVFAGYGITAPEYHYDDYEKIDPRGKVALVLRHEPQEADEKSIFAGKNYTLHSELASKVANAKLHGAAAVLLVNDLPNHTGDDDRLDPFTAAIGTEDYGLPVVQISVKWANELLATSQKDIAGLIKAVDGDLKPRSFDLPTDDAARMTVNITIEKRHVHNVAGFWPGETNQYIILGAHYDHLGLGFEHSLAPSQAGTVHPGADDNASGTAGVIELARAIAHSGKHKRGFLFLCFAGEEEGLLGSAYFANHPLEPLGEATAMINMDMIGRLRNGKVYVGGIGSGSTFKPIVEKAAKDYGLDDDLTGSGVDGSSDHTSFLVKGVPTLFFFSGLHSDYHKPSDTWDKINADDAVKLLGEIDEIATTLADATNRPAFVKLQPTGHGELSGSSSSQGYGPYFGSIPDFGGTAKGVRFSDVREGSPAAKAGFKAGDVMVEFDGKDIANLYDFTYALRQHKPGDTVLVIVLRDGIPVEKPVLLTKRP
jgi:aminopeptidase YwaD